MSRRMGASHHRRRAGGRRKRVGGWSRTTLWRLRLVFGPLLLREPVLLALERWATGERLGFMRIRIPHAGIEIWICGRMPRWRRVTKAPRAAVALQELAVRWEAVQKESGFRTWLSDVESAASTDPRKLDAVLCRALVLEVLGRRGRRWGR